MSHSRTASALSFEAPKPRRSLTVVIAEGLATRRERLALARLDTHLLDDIGVDPKSAWSEAKRPFWELPGRHHW